MPQPRTSPRRRSRREWSKLVAAWQRSGLTAEAFAASHRVVARTLIWWRWQLAQAPGAPRRSHEDSLRLVRVEPEAAPVAPATPAWELALASGAVLRVHAAGIAPEALRVLLDRLGPARPARPAR